MKKNGLVVEDKCDRTKWRGVVKTMTIQNPANSVDGDNPDPKCDDDNYTWESKACQGVQLMPCLLFLPFRGKGGQSLPSKLALHVQYECKKNRCKLLTVNFEIQKVPF